MIHTSQKEAKNAGAKHYYTGKPCKAGHIATRYISGACVECSRLNSNKRYAASPEKHREWKARWLVDNQELYRARRKKWRSAPASRATEMLAGAKFSAKQKGLPFDRDEARNG